MKILSLNVQNYLRLEALEIIPKGNTVTITGKNDQGKSSALKAIDAALTGAKGAVEQPIHGDASKAVIEIKLGNGETVSAIVTRTYVKRDDKDDLATLTVTTADGAKYPKPQEFLDKVLGGLSLDPVKFMDMKPAEQAAAVRGFVKDYDFVEAARLNKEDYAKRTDINREVKRLEGEVSGLAEVDEIGEIIDVQDLVSKLDKINEVERTRLNAENKLGTAKSHIPTYKADIQGKERRVDELEDQLAAAKRELSQSKTRLEDAEEAIAQLEREFADLPMPDDAQAIRDQIAEAEQHNNSVRDLTATKSRRERLSAQLDDEKAKSQQLTEAMQKRDAAGTEAIKNAKLPIEGLSFTEDTVLLNGYPFSQASFSKRLMTAVAISAAHAPDLRLVRIEDGDKLDDDSKAMLAEFAEKHDLQVWMETVQHGQPVGFVIEDGKLREYAE